MSRPGQGEERSTLETGNPAELPRVALDELLDLVGNHHHARLIEQWDAKVGGAEGLASHRASSLAHVHSAHRGADGANQPLGVRSVEQSGFVAQHSTQR